MTMTEFKTWAFPQEVEENCLLPKVLILGSYPCGNITIVSVHAELYVSELSPRFYYWINFSLGIFPCVLVMHVMYLYYLKCLYGRLDFVLSEVLLLTFSFDLPSLSQNYLVTL